MPWRAPRPSSARSSSAQRVGDPVAPGHWIPEMVWLAGGRFGDRRRWLGVSADLVGRRSSRAAQCGGGRGVRLRQAGHDSFGPRPGESRCFAPGGSGRCGGCERVWARPGTRLVDGIEELADFLHPRPTSRRLALSDRCSDGRHHRRRTWLAGLGAGSSAGGRRTAGRMAAQPLLGSVSRGPREPGVLDDFLQLRQGQLSQAAGPHKH